MVVRMQAKDLMTSRSANPSILEMLVELLFPTVSETHVERTWFTQFEEGNGENSCNTSPSDLSIRALATPSCKRRTKECEVHFQSQPSACLEFAYPCPAERSLV